MPDIDLNSVLSAKDEAAIDVLVRETKAEPAVVSELYRIERASLQRVATISTYVPLLASKQVRQKLKEEQRRRNM